MKVYPLKREQWLPIPVEEAWAFFSTPRNLDRITPPELGFKIQKTRIVPFFVEFFTQ